MNWSVLQQALVDYFENVDGGKEEFASHLQMDASDLERIVRNDQTPDFDFGRKLEHLLKTAISFRVNHEGKSGLRPGWYKVCPRAGSFGAVCYMKVSEIGAIEFSHDVDLGEDFFRDYLIVRHFEADWSAGDMNTSRHP